jgi:LmbE family N-acetylglucosaminyl deacetylase
VLQFPFAGRPGLTHVLALGSHSDDIEIGCGATLLALTRARPEVEVTWVVLGAHGTREREARASAKAFLGAASRSEVVVYGFRDGYFPYIGGEVKDVFEELKGRLDPDVIFTHARNDLHQDHRLVCELTWNTWRNHLILEYEIPKYDGDLGSPNVFVPVSEELAREKARLIAEVFASQQDKHWFEEDLFMGLMRIRGMEVSSPSGYAEAFVGRKLSLPVAEN